MAVTFAAIAPSHGTCGNPAQPDARVEPDMFKHWQQMFVDDTAVAIEPVLQRYVPQPTDLGARPSRRKAKARLHVIAAGVACAGGGAIGQGAQIAVQKARSGEEPSQRRRSSGAVLSSRNWSGAVVPASSDRQFTRIVGAWSAPDIGRHPPDGNPTQLISIWLGIGGAEPWSDSMPQVGSEHGWIGGKEVHRFWVQWWQGHNPDGFLSSLVTNIAIAAGDRMMFSLSVDDDGDNKRVRFHVKRCAKQGTPGALAGILASSDRPAIASSADWVAERPTEVVFGQPVGGYRPLVPLHPRPLPPCVGVFMDQCVARLGPQTDPRVRRPFDAALVSLESIMHGPSRLVPELSPAVYSDPKTTQLSILRRVP